MQLTLTSKKDKTVKVVLTFCEDLDRLTCHAARNNDNPKGVLWAAAKKKHGVDTDAFFPSGVSL